MHSFSSNDTTTTEIYTLSLHDALPICTIVGLTRGTTRAQLVRAALEAMAYSTKDVLDAMTADRKSTRLNSSHVEISYAVFCLKKKNRTRVLMCCCRMMLMV